MKLLPSTAFLRYSSVGVLNTLLHWSIFLLLVNLFGINQAISNTIAFMAAVSFSYVANARYTFARPRSLKRYAMFVSFMGIFSFILGFIMDRFSAPPIITLILFSTISLVLGYLYSRHIIFR